MSGSRALVLALLPLAAVAVVVLRQVVGLSTLGTFTPVLLTLGVLQVGFVPVLFLTTAVVGLGLALEPALRRWRMPRVARLAALIGVAATVLLLLEAITGLRGAADSWGAAFPLIVAAGLVERIHENVVAEGRGEALRDAASMILALVVGSYRGLRLSELVRFDRAARTAEVSA